MHTKDIVKQYKRSQQAIKKRTGLTPYVAFVSKKNYKEKVVKALSAKGFTVVSKTVSDLNEKTLRKKNFIVLQKPKESLFHDTNTNAKDSGHKPVSLKTCFKKDIYKFYKRK